MYRYFLPYQIDMLSKAVSISEDIVSDAFSLTNDYWKKNTFEVKTLQHERIDVPTGTYAHLSKYANNFEEKNCGTDNKSLYKIIVIDPQVLKATRGIPKILKPFFVYIITHELIHILRFSKFECVVTNTQKEEEEEIVHNLTNKVLTPIKIRYLDLVIDYFKGKIVKLSLN